jgi:hypothetical protein
MRWGDGAEDSLLFGLAGEDDAHNFRVSVLNAIEQLGAIHRRHAHVGDDGVEGLLRENFESGLAAGSELHIPFPVHIVQGAAKAGEHHGVVVNKEQAFHEAFSWAAWMGRWM